MQAPIAKTKNSLLGDEQAIEAQDAFLDRLSHLAYPVSKEKLEKAEAEQDKQQQEISKNLQATIEVSSKYQSKFFKHVDDRNEIDVLEEYSTENKTLPDVNAVIASRSESYAKELPEYIQSDLVKSREFFLTVLAPKAFALQTGLDQAVKIIEEQVAEIDTTTVTFCQRACMEAMRLKIISFIKDYLSLSEAEALHLTDLLLKKQVINMFNLNDAKQ